MTFIVQLFEINTTRSRWYQQLSARVANWSLTTMKHCTSCPEGYKPCTMCQGCFPATPQYFLRNKNGLYGLQAYCKDCSYALRHGLLCKIDPYEKAGKKPCNRCGQIKSAAEFYPAKRGKLGRRPTCIECELTIQRENLPTIRVRQRERYHQNPQVSVSIKNWQNANRQKVRRFKNNWKQNNAEQVHLMDLRRRARIRSLPDSFTTKQYRQMMAYWNHACAITGQTTDLHIDHWIPIANADCPGTIATNLIPLAAHLNANKSMKHPHQWVYETFGKQEAENIVQRIEAYFKWVLEQL